MHAPSTESLTPLALLKLLREHQRLWVLPAVVGLLLGIVAALLIPRYWQSSQGLIIRPEAAGISEHRLGKFSDLSEMKTVQETIFELARSRSVITAALREVGPSPSYRNGAQWPTLEDIVDFRDQLKITPPGGAEFGKTEVFYLSVLDRSPQRAGALVEALTGQLEARVQQLRDERARSMIRELEEGVQRAEAELGHRVGELAEYEGRVGADLSELRNLVSPLAGQGGLSQHVLALQLEMRNREADVRRQQKLLETLRAAQENPELLVATPASLLASQPVLEKLKSGLAEAQLTTASLLGTRASSHPFVAAAMESQREIRRQLYREIPGAIQSVALELEVLGRQVADLHEQLAALNQKESHLAGFRARYAQIVADVESQTAVVAGARRQLAEAESQQAGAESASLIARIDEVESGVRPVGPGRSTIAAGGAVCGLLTGLGLVFLLHGPVPRTINPTAVSPAGMPGTLATERARAGAEATALLGAGAIPIPRIFGVSGTGTISRAIRNLSGRIPVEAR